MKLKLWRSMTALVGVTATIAVLAVACQGELDPAFLNSRAATSTAETAKSQAAKAEATATAAADELNRAATQSARPLATQRTATATPRSLPTIQRQPADPARPLPTLGRPVPTRTPVPQPAQTTDPSASSTPSSAQPTPTAGALPTPGGAVPTPVGRPTPEATPAVFGPYSGSLVHLSNGDDAEEFPTGVDTRNFVATSTFVNPFPASQREWNIGLWFRVERAPDTFWTRGFPFPGTRHTGMMLVLESNGRWTLFKRDAIVATQGSQIDDEFIQTGNAGGVKTDLNEENTISVMAYGDHGSLVVNGELIAELDLSLVPNSGDVVVIAGALEDDEFAGSFTRFHSLVIAEASQVQDVATSDSSGRLVANQPKTPFTGVTGNFVLDVEIPVVTPIFSGIWSWAVALEGETETVRVSLGSDGIVTLERETDSDDGGIDSTVMFSSMLASLSNQVGDKNYVRVVANSGKLGFIVDGVMLPGITPVQGETFDVVLSAFVRGETSTAGAVVQPGVLRLWKPAE